MVSLIKFIEFSEEVFCPPILLQDWKLIDNEKFDEYQKTSRDYCEQLEIYIKNAQKHFSSVSDSIHEQACRVLGNGYEYSENDDKKWSIINTDFKNTKCSYNEFQASIINAMAHYERADEIETSRNDYNLAFRRHIAVIEEILLEKLKNDLIGKEGDESEEGDEGPNDREQITIQYWRNYWPTSDSLQNHPNQVQPIQEEAKDSKKKLSAQIKKLDEQIQAKFDELYRDVRGLSVEERYNYENRFECANILPLQNKRQAIKQKLDRLTANKSRASLNRRIMN